MKSVESLSVPNEKLRNLNQLLADIYQLDKSRSVFVEEDTAHNFDYYNQIQNEIKFISEQQKLIRENHKE